MDRMVKKKLQDRVKIPRGVWRAFRNPLSLIGASIILALIIAASVAHHVAPNDPLKTDLSRRLERPCKDHLLGTDQLGRDILSRILYGSRISLRIAIIVALLSGSIGGLVGIIAGYFRGKIDELLMRVTDMFMAFPHLILAMAFAAALGPSLDNLVIAISLVAWPTYARLVRSMALAIREEDYVEAARAVGAGNWRILRFHVLPMCISPLIIQMTLGMGGIILTAAGLGFIGFGAQPPTPEWGVMIAEGRNYLSNQWWVSTFPGLAILITVLGFNLLGDGIRDILDPRMRGFRG
jgi:peptide/nickel transport system permease protein